MVGLGVQFFVHRALRAQSQIHVRMQHPTGTSAPWRNMQCIATPYQASEVRIAISRISLGSEICIVAPPRMYIIHASCVVT